MRKNSANSFKYLRKTTTITTIKDIIITIKDIITKIQDIITTIKDIKTI